MMKRFKHAGSVCLLLALMLVTLGAYSSVFAAAEDADGHLLFHYDFLGTTDAERLSNKASGGKTGSLTLKGGQSEIQEGYAYVSKAAGNYLTAKVGEDVKAINGKATLFAVFQAEGKPTAMVDVGQITSTVRVAMVGSGPMVTRVGTDIRTSDKTNLTVTSPHIPYGVWVYVAVTLDYDADGNVSERVYLSMDGGKTYTSQSGSYQNVAGMFSAADDLLLGKVNPNISDRGVSFYYRDIRLYDRVLTENDLKAIEVAEFEDPGTEEEDPDLPPRDLSEYLVAHYDFAGDTEEEQLRDKAPSGVSQDDLLLYSSVDENHRKRSYISNGTAYIAKEACNFLYAPAGEDITGTDGTLTVFAAFMATGDTAKMPCDLVGIDNTLRIGFSHHNYLFTRVGNCDLLSVGPDSGTLSRDTWIYVAISLTYNQEKSTVEQKLYVSTDEGKTYTAYSARTGGVGSMFSDSTYLSFGRIKPTMEDRGTGFWFRDIRIYHCAVRASELDQIQVDAYTPGVRPSAPVSGNGADQSAQPDDQPVQEIENISDSGKPDENNTSGISETPTAGDTQSPGKSSGAGCRSNITGAGILFFAVVFCTVWMGGNVIRLKKAAKRFEEKQ